MGKGEGRFARLKNWVKKTILEEHYRYDLKNLGREKEIKNLFKKILVRPFLSKYRKMYHATIPFFDKVKVLDIGCANGDYLAWLKELGWEPYGVEIDENCVKFARKEYGIDIFCGDLLETKFPDNYFDCVTMWQSLHIHHHPLQILREINRILKKNGLVVVSVPNINSLEAKLLKEKSFLFDIPRHLYDFSPRTLKNLLKKAGLRTEKIIYLPRVDSFQWSLDSLFQEKGYKIRVESKWRTNPLAILTAELLSLCHMSSIMTFYVRKACW